MSRFAPYFGVAFILFVGVIAVILANGFKAVPYAPTTAPAAASSTVFVVPPAIVPQKPSETATSTPKTSVPENVVKPPVKIVSAPPKIATSTPPTLMPVVAPTPVSVPGNTPLDAAASVLRGALVNIICYAPAGSSLQSISGSGILIDPKGIILTNAHVAQYFLLADRGVSCSIRAGSPATDQYKASLIYISPSWIHANASVLAQMAPIGTGEYDFALLAITQSETSTALSSSFPYIPLAMMSPDKGTPIVIASFGAQFLDYTQIESSLSPTVVFGSVKDVFTFGTNTIDALDLGGSAAAQEGSSGGGLTDSTGTLIGTITTSTIVGATNTRSLSAITASYIRSEYASEMAGSSLDVLLSVPTASSITDFATQIPLLESIITAHL